jgi:MFS family permease
LPGFGDNLSTQHRKIRQTPYKLKAQMFGSRIATVAMAGISPARVRFSHTTVVKQRDKSLKLIAFGSSRSLVPNGSLRAPLPRMEDATLASTHKNRPIKTQSLIGLNAINFFQAEMVGVVLPSLSAFLKEAGWRYDSIGLATAAAGLGTLLFQTIAGGVTDRVSSRRFLFATAAIFTGFCFVAIPLVPHSQWWINGLLFLSGAVQSLFAPLLGALALALVGHEMLNRTAGINQGWNHAGNIVAAVTAIALVRFFGLSSILYAVGFSSLLAAASVFLIKQGDLDEHRATGLTTKESNPISWRGLLRDPAVLWLIVSIFIFHLANAPILPATALYVKKLGGSDSLMTATVLTAQLVMVPVALFAGRYGDRWGRKAVMGIAFWFLPLRIFAYTLVASPKAVVWLQGLDGIGAGIYGVVVIALAADLTRGKGRFNALAGIFATAVACGGVVGPILSGALLQHLGFKSTFYAFAVLAAAGAVIFTLLVPETRDSHKTVTSPLSYDAFGSTISARSNSEQ